MPFVAICLVSCQTTSSDIAIPGTTETEKLNLPTPSPYPQITLSSTPTLEAATSTPPFTPTDPYMQMKTADALGTPLDSWSVSEVLPTIFPYATPTLMSGHSFWIVDLRKENPKSNVLVVFQYPTNQWEEFPEVAAREQGYQKGMLIHGEIDGCLVSENFLSPPIWSSEVKESFKPWEPFSRIRTFIGDKGEWLFKIFRIGNGIDMRITYPSEQQDECHVEALKVIYTNAFSFVDGTPEP